MKRKYPKTKGMAVIFEKNRLQKEINRKVCREICRRVKRGEKIVYIIDLLSKPNNLKWFGDMVGKNADSWARTYRRYMAQTRKKRTTVNSALSPINIGCNGS